MIPRERVMAIPDVIYCVNCQSKEQSNNPDAMLKKVEEGFGGSREDCKKIGGNISAINDKVERQSRSSLK